MESDIQLAKKYLIEKRLGFVFFKNGVLIAQSRESGIRDLYRIAWLYKEELKGSSVADKVVGKAAGSIIIYLQVKECFARVVSEGALELFRRAGVRCSFDEKVSVILNRNKTDLCPFEKLVLDLKDPFEVYLKVKEKIDGESQNS
jgi:hypothetical protein